ncbi:glycosyl hydrolase [Microlunatus flavus]|uniref:glucan endo-1,3-beta-D-glucosidase n=1 Tax=Microlunatus flavus TaxID=1036181 RepID=A0A1H9CRZ7_9ACTN|nr:glycosyl hydrolase [Microlunatus flavus]SEQ03363.1 Endoglucanase Acf2 [Microlunatus flavus]
MRRGALALVALTLVLGLAACTPGAPRTGGSGSGSTPAATSGEVLPAAQVDPLVAGVVHRTVKPLPTSRLADGLVPPTNRWFSGLVFGDQPQPVFPLPLSFGLTGSGFSFGQPRVTTTAKTIAGGFAPDVAVDAGASSAVVSAYDALSVTVESRDASGVALGRTVVAEGSPFVAYHVAKAGSVRTNLPWAEQDGFWTAAVGGVTYAMVVADGTVQGGTVELEASGVATWFPVPADGSAGALAALAAHPLTGGSVASTTAGDRVTTTLAYRSDGDTAYARLPHQSADPVGEPRCDLGSYPSVYGTLTLCSGSALSWSAPAVQPTSALDTTRLSGEDKATLAAQVRADVAATPAFPSDTYFGGKALYRAAMLYQLATQVGADDAAASIKARLVTSLDQWTDPQGCAHRTAVCFVYDEQAKGLVGMTPSFGSDEFNDHHFHYGYFLFAAGVLAESDPALATRWAPVMNLLAADLASSSANGAFPDLRVFDVYAGHSWASGTAPFADGNNQESSSEAVTAWTGLATWAKATGDDALHGEAVWLLSLEAQSAKAYWTDVDRSQPVYAGFDHQVVSLNWGGKRDYGTWFSAEPAAILGIQLIPMSPAATYLGGDPARIEANVKEATGGSYDQKFGDYLLMYSALAGNAQRESALAKAKTLDAQWIDDGNSRTYLLAWLMTAKA